MSAGTVAMSRYRRHVRLHDALAELRETHQIQRVEIPADIATQYYERYALTLASRTRMRVQTRVLDERGKRFLFVGERQ